MSTVEVACLCPIKANGEPRHPKDRITLRERLDFRGALAVRGALGGVNREDSRAAEADYRAVLLEYYLLYGIESWTLIDSKGQPIEVTRTAIREHLLSRFDEALTVGNAADALYFEQVIAPLAQAASTSSPPSSTSESTSARNGSEPRAPKPSRPSSISTIPTDATETTTSSLAGVSN